MAELHTAQCRITKLLGQLAPSPVSNDEHSSLVNELRESTGYFQAERGSRHFSQKKSIEEYRSRFGVDSKIIFDCCNELSQKGYVVIPNAISQEEIKKIKKSCEKHWDSMKGGDTNFHGYQTIRIQGVPNKIPESSMLLEHPIVLSIIDEFLPKNYLLGNAQAIKTAPGETVQPFHYDGSVYPIHDRKNSEDWVVVSLWALEDFTKENGATRLIPKSHLWDGNLTKIQNFILFFFNSIKRFKILFLMILMLNI